MEVFFVSVNKKYWCLEKEAFIALSSVSVCLFCDTPTCCDYPDVFKNQIIKYYRVSASLAFFKSYSKMCMTKIFVIAPLQIPKNSERQITKLFYCLVFQVMYRILKGPSAEMFDSVKTLVKQF